MTTTTEVGRARRTGARPAPRPEPGARKRPELRVVEAPVARKRFVVIGAGLAMVLLFGSLFGLAALHTMFVQGQLRMDRLDRDIAKAQATQTELRYEVADLSSPQRILDEAKRLSMVQPQDPVYLKPVVPGGPVTVPPYARSLTQTKPSVKTVPPSTVAAATTAGSATTVAPAAVGPATSGKGAPTTVATTAKATSPTTTAKPATAAPSPTPPGATAPTTSGKAVR